MANQEFIHSNNAPAALGPYSQAVKIGNFVYTSGQVGLDPATGELINWKLRDQTEQVFKNLKAVLEASSLTLQDVVKTTVFLAHMSDFAEMNGIYADHFGDNRPARSTVEVARLPKDALIEIEVIAVSGAKG
ncbi:MAG: putative translation initiation inhibitor [Chloroflexi bacterium]|jgi:2-iminobutanoate/2-iminopropanoate deaminase|nr:putative translation initiation inhibitor [Chloroflexota bacterium]